MQGSGAVIVLVPSRWAFVSCILVFGLSTAAAQTCEDHQYCIVGAGPAGIQLGHLMHQIGRDYAIFERGAGVAEFSCLCSADLS